MRVLRYTRTSFERQIYESVLIQENRSHHHLLNSKSEYNRCAIPRLTMKLGDREMKQEEIRQEVETKREEELMEKIRGMKKDWNRRRGNGRGNPVRKKLKLDTEMTAIEMNNKPEMKISTPEKRQNNEKEMNTRKTKQRKLDGYFKVMPDCRVRQIDRVVEVISDSEVISERMVGVIPDSSVRSGMQQSDRGVKGITDCEFITMDSGGKYGETEWLGLSQTAR